MNKILWTFQIILALVFTAAGLGKLFTPHAELVTQMPWVTDFSEMQVKAIGALEFAGVLGLILPSVLRILPILTPLASSGLVLTMAGAAMTHAQRGEWTNLVVNLVLGLAAAFVAWGRFKREPIQARN